MKKIIVTDLTRFSKGDKVCTAGIDVDTGECLRPMPYLNSARCAELNIQPGAILKGDLNIHVNTTSPHIEDANYTKLEFHGPSKAKEFKDILDNSLSGTVSLGFGIAFGVGQKYIPIEMNANCSIITIKVNPYEIQIHEDQYKPGKVKCSFTDQSGNQFRYLSITDRGFYDYAQRHQNDGSLNILQNFLQSQDDIYLRIGLSRAFQISDRNGYWLQVNGIYTFPKFHQEIRSYQ
ncbi:hypothetical protein [Desulfobacula sp.]|uniref:dual OB domain-containing protein n=1 Tax=Desulfobacula sp. TaxID=2593537 RepID=UPI002627FBDD|nr:hypothetical protein [Desulfobacula sp.]